MSINLRLPENTILKPSITVFGAGGAGGNAVNNMISANLEGVKFVTANTDAQALEYSLSENRIQLGETITRGLGAGASPEVGRAAAEEAAELIIDNLQGSNMLFITAGMGGGTGTGAAPVIARIAREHGILTVGVVTKPFHFEGAHRMKLAELGLLELQKYVDTLIVIPNQNLFRLANEKTTFADAFRMADEVLHAGVRGITDLMIMPGLINLDFADIRAVMSEMGKAMMGTGEAEGEDRAIKAAEAAIANPLLDNCSMKGARGVLINITGGLDMTLFEVDAAANRIRDEVDAEEANIIFGSTFNPALEGRIRVSVVATGIDAHSHQENDKYYLLKDMVDNNSKAAISSKITTTELHENKLAEEDTDSYEHQNEVFSSNRSVESQFSYDIPNSENVKKTEKYNTRYNTTPASSKANDKLSDKNTRLGLFGRMANSVGLRTNVEEHNKSYEREEELVSADGLGEDVFDIPAFLRRKNTNK
ncbi:Cell division protein FtsZ [Rickettsiales bacterium Ac37b]|nr:Cell division protein FtsZ [Rickettsiales bacterium Ac37b]